MAVIALPTHLTNPQVSLIASTYYILTYSNPQFCQVGSKFQEWVWKLTWFQWNRFRVSECCPCLAASLECCWHAMSVIRQERERGGVCVKAVKWYHANLRSRRLTSYCLTDLAESRPVSVVMLASGHWLTVDWARANECGLEGGWKAGRWSEPVESRRLSCAAELRGLPSATTVSQPTTANFTTHSWLRDRGWQLLWSCNSCVLVINVGAGKWLRSEVDLE